MKMQILDLLTCPSCGKDLDLEIFVKEASEVKEGLLRCSCKMWYPIINFIPRLLLKEYRKDYKLFLDTYSLEYLKEQNQNGPHREGKGTQTQRSFSSKWASQPSWGIRGETKAFMKEWVFKKYGWGDKQGLEDSLKNRKRILEIGTGLGRDTGEFCKGCKNGEVFGVDLSEAVEAAYQNTKEYRNANIIQADLLCLPLKKRYFDFIFSEGVLHHTSDTQKAFEGLLEYLSPGGEIAIYIYRIKSPIREFCDEYIRQYTTKFSAEECWDFSRQITKFGQTLSDLNIELEIPEDIPVLKIKAGKYDLQRFFYYHIFKCFWNERFTFDENNLINFDWYHPAYAHRHTPEEVRAWFKKSGLQVTHLDISESGITARGLKPL